MTEYITIDVHCMSCGKKILPNETEMDLFRLGLPCHNTATSPECFPALYEDLVRKGVIRPQEVSR